MWSYPPALGAGSVAGALLERLAPARPTQRALRAGLPTDLVYLVFNGHFLGVGLAWVAARTVDPLLAGRVELHLATGWPLWMQALAALFLLDFAQWSIHLL